MVPRRHEIVKKNKRKLPRLLALLAILIIAGLFIEVVRIDSADNPPKPAAKKTVAVPAVNECANNSLSQLVLVSISKQHLWACDLNKTVFDSPVVTGMENYPADLTPTGTYKIYAKYTDQTLTGEDSTGSWSDFVHYWMPFLSNQYGIYGFHDATWRPNNAFGNINIYSNNASHGCVELPLATAAWIYNWSSVGTTVTIEN